MPSARYLWVCGACGGPRIPGVSEPSSALARGREAIAAAFGWGAGAIVLALAGLAATALASILALASTAAGVAVGIVAFLMLIMGWRASARAGALRKRAKMAVDEGWREGALAILRGRGSDATAEELAKAMCIDEVEADRLLTALSAEDRVRVDVGEGRVRYRVDAPVVSTADEITESAGEKRGGA